MCYIALEYEIFKKTSDFRKFELTHIANKRTKKNLAMQNVAGQGSFISA